MIRRGTSLVELLVVIALSGVVLALVSGLLGVMLRADSQARGQAAQESELSRLSLAFRADAHAASSAQVGESTRPADRLTFALANSRSIEYVAQDNRIDRLRKQDAAVVHRDSFRLSARQEGMAASVRFQTKPSADGASLAVIVIEWRSALEPQSQATPRAAEIVAATGRDDKLRAAHKAGETP